MLIAIEGIDGAGKTTIARFLRDELQKMGYDVVLLKEPTDSEWGRKIKESLNNRLSAEEELELFILDRKYDVEKNILPALKSGKIVIMDRYYYSNIAYQAARGIDAEKIRRMNEEIAPKPDLVILLDAPPELCLERVKKRGMPNEFEKLSYLRKVREVFRSLDNIAVIDAGKDLEEVKKDVLKEILKLLRK